MKTLIRLALICLFSVSCNRANVIGPDPNPTPIPDPTPKFVSVDSPDTWHRLVDATSKPTAMTFQLLSVIPAPGSLVKPVGAVPGSLPLPCPDNSCFGSTGNVCMDAVPNPTGNPYLASMALIAYWSADGITPLLLPHGSPATAGLFTKVLSGTCVPANIDRTNFVSGGRFLLLHGTYGPVGQMWGDKTPVGAPLGGVYAYDLGYHQ